MWLCRNCLLKWCQILFLIPVTYTYVVTQIDNTHRGNTVLVLQWSKKRHSGSEYSHKYVKIWIVISKHSFYAKLRFFGLPLQISNIAGMCGNFVKLIEKHIIHKPVSIGSAVLVIFKKMADNLNHHFDWLITGKNSDIFLDG